MFTSCEDKMEFGEAYIFMPQATTDGGITQVYNVPSAGKELTYNFKTENGKINIILGVLLSGNFQNDYFSVKVDVLNEETAKLIQSGNVENAKILPKSLYTLPPMVTVNNANQATFYLSLDSVALIDNPAFSGRNLVETIGLSNPTKYELASGNTFTNVVINVDELREILQQ